MLWICNGSAQTVFVKLVNSQEQQQYKLIIDVVESVSKLAFQGRILEIQDWSLLEQTDAAYASIGCPGVLEVAHSSI